MSRLICVCVCQCDAGERNAFESLFLLPGTLRECAKTF